MILAASNSDDWAIAVIAVAIIVFFIAALFFEHRERMAQIRQGEKSTETTTTSTTNPD